MEFRILGPIDVRGANGAVALGGNKPRAVLAVLLLHANEPVSAERLALALWGEDAPGSAVKTVQVHVSRLRKALGDPDIVDTSAAGYRLRVRPDELDAQRFERLVEDGRRALSAGQAEQASSLLRDALSLWRGPALAELADEPFAAAEIARLEEQRLAALEARVEADLAAGRHAELVGELQQLVGDHPIRERLAGQLMLALYRCGRQSEALEAYAQARRMLVSEIGVEPGPELRRLQDAILRQDASLEPQPLVPQLPAQLDAAAAPPLVGREAELAWLQERWERARGGAGGLVTIIGGPGSGKTRLAAELAGACSGAGTTVLYAAGSARAEAILSRAAEAAHPTLVVVELPRLAAAEVHARLEELASTLTTVPVLVIATGVEAEPLARLGSQDTLTLESLGARAVQEIAASYAPGVPAGEVPVQGLLEASGGVPQRVHEVAGQWAQREAARRVGAVAGRAAAGRAELRSIEAELTGDVVELQAAGERILVKGDDDAPVVCPFKGLASFEVADAQYFFGRERLVAELVARLVGAPLLAVVGPSGSGKSSVTKAGLLPALAGGVLPGSDGWTQVLIRPGEHPLRELREAMAAVDGREHVVIAVDQFEETFTTCRDEDERTAFIAELVEAAEDRRERAVVVIALRADFYGRCAAYPGLSELVAANHVLVGAMRSDELRRAIERPAQRVGLRVDSELADALVADVKDEPGALPLLSTALLELWQQRDGRRLRYPTYEQTGGVRGAVARLAEDAFGKLDEAQQEVARGVLMRLAGEGAAGTVERRRVALAELGTERDEDVARVVALLTDRRLLTVSEGTIEFAHEALLREWPRLRGWIDEDREGLRIQRSLSAGAREWERLGRDEGALYQGSRLAEASEWNAFRRPSLNALEREFLDASEARRERERAQRRRRLVAAFSGLVIVLVAISIVAIVSVSQGREAKRQRDVAASRDLAGRAAGLLESDPGLSRMVALAAYDRHDTEEAESAVRQATLGDRATAILSADAGEVYTSSPSADGRLVATAGEDGSVRTWDLRRRRVAATIKGHDGPARAAAFSPDGTKIATGGEDGQVALANGDGTNRRVLLRIPAAPDADTYPNSVDFSRDGGRLVVGARDHSVRIVNLADGTSRVLGRHADGVRMARFDRTGRKVVSAGFDGLARIWDVATGNSIALPHGDTYVIDASFSPDGRRVATTATDGLLRIWDAARARPLVKLKVVAQDLLSVRYSPDGRQLVTAGGDGVVRVYGAHRAILLGELKGHFGYVYDAAFAAGGTIVSSGEDGALRLWAPVETVAIRGDATGPRVTSDGRHVVSGDEDGHVHRWDLTTGRDRRLPGHLDSASVARESADGTRIVSAAQDGTVRITDVGSGRSRLVPSDTREKLAVAIDRTGRRFAAGGQDGRTTIYGDDGRKLRELRGHTSAINGLDFSPDGRHLASASSDETARIFNVETGKLEQTFVGHGDSVISVAYSADGRRIVTAGTDATVSVWPIGGGDPIVLYGHLGSINSAVFNRRGDRLVSAGSDGTVRVWDAAGGESLVVLHRHAIANGADFTPDGRRVLSAGGEGVANTGVLRLSACPVCGRFEDVLRLARSRADRKLSPADRQRLLSAER
ncbi:MAG: BTAD domain-containing putative transcriptional regulator [Solirubrobacteraceae bacterium]